MADFGDAVHEKGNVASEQIFDLFKSGLCVFDRVVQDACEDAVDVHIPFDERTGNRERVGDIGLAALSLLPPVLGGRVIDGMLELGDLIVVIELTRSLQHISLPHDYV